MHRSPDLDHWPLPALLLDRRGRILNRSERASAVLAANAEVLQVADGRLVTPQAPALLDTHLARIAALATQAAPPAAASAALALHRPGRLPLTLRSQPWGPSAGTVLMGLCDPQAYTLCEATLQALFGLTVAEARVAAAVADGLSTAEIALSVGVQINTVQAHLKRLLSKTGTARQARLVSLLWRSVATQYQKPGSTPRNEGGAPKRGAGGLPMWATTAGGVAATLTSDPARAVGDASPASPIAILPPTPSVAPT